MVDELSETARVEDAEERPRLLVFWDGGSFARPLPAAGSLIIGRAPTCDVRIDHASVSRKHAVLHLGVPLRIEDLGGANGTKVGERKLAPGGSFELRAGEIVTLGTAVVTV